LTQTRTARKLSPSTLVAGGFVFAAAVIAWFGLSGSASSPAEQPIVTSAGNERPARPVAAVAGVSTGGLPTRIVVPAAGVDASIAEVGVTVQSGKAAWETAWRAAGHHLDSAMPGQPGNMVITGHVSVADRSNLAVFRDLEGVAAGDVVEVFSGDQRYTYQVDRVLVVPPGAVKLLRSDSTSTVTLITCTKDLKNRLVVIGTLTA
jgi:LPXTG-site transpeptidase (sortase) family protein